MTLMRSIMRFFSLRRTSRVVLLSMVMTGSIALCYVAQAAAVKPAKTSAANVDAGTQKNSAARLTPANSTDGIIALVNENAILKSDLIAAMAQTQARAQAAGEPIANSAQLQSEVLNALI